MQEHNVILTWEAIYDIADIADYIEMESFISIIEVTLSTKRHFHLLLSFIS